jgi:hypothetical protein
MRLHLVCLCLGALVACVEREGPDTPKPDDGYLKENLLSKAPSPGHPVNADLGGKVIYLGADVDKDRAAIGDKVKVVHYWKVVEPPGAEWRLFTHVNGSRGDWINVDETRMRKGYGPDRWKAGDIVRDEQVFPILPSWKSPDATIYVGMFRKGGQSEKDRMSVKSGPSDGKDRVKVATIAIGSAAPAMKDRPLAVARVSAPIKLDGKPAEADWGKAAVAGPFRQGRRQLVQEDRRPAVEGGLRRALHRRRRQRQGLRRAPGEPARHRLRRLVPRRAAGERRGLVERPQGQGRRRRHARQA